MQAEMLSCGNDTAINCHCCKQWS